MPTPPFTSVYHQGFVRVAAATPRTTIVEPAANAASLLTVARTCHDEGVGLGCSRS
jgi:NAD+ synthase (glutamine-hydrolysing)